MRQRVRPKWSDEELAEIYDVPHRHDRWIDHQVRVRQTIAVGQVYADASETIADLSTGDAAIPRGLATKGQGLILGDFAPKYPIVGPIEETIDTISNVDLFVLSETLEHLDDPDLVLRKIRSKTKALILSTPLEEWDTDNLEHYWAWSKEDIHGMLGEAGFHANIYSSVQFEYLGGYGFQIWGCL
jgi:hypothetical protein